MTDDDKVLTPDEAAELTPREREVLDHAAAGLTVTETAHRMSRSPRTVKTWRESILRKLAVPNMTAAVAAYREQEPVG